MTLLDRLAEHMTARVEELRSLMPGDATLETGLPAQAPPRTTLLLDGHPEHPVPVPTASLPERHLVMQVGYHRILIGSLSTSDDWQDELNRYLNLAAIEWSWLGRRGEDLLLLLVGPAGSDGEEQWLQRRGLIERDDRVCRKLVWLPPGDDPDVEGALNVFISRTFLARPWLSPALRSQTLDGLTNLAQFFREAGMSESEAHAWIEILSAPGENDFLVDDLIGALEGPQ